MRKQWNARRFLAGCLSVCVLAGVDVAAWGQFNVSYCYRQVNSHSTAQADMGGLLDDQWSTEATLASGVYDRNFPTSASSMVENYPYGTFSASATANATLVSMVSASEISAVAVMSTSAAHMAGDATGLANIGFEATWTVVEPVSVLVHVRGYHFGRVHTGASGQYLVLALVGSPDNGGGGYPVGMSVFGQTGTFDPGSVDRSWDLQMDLVPGPRYQVQFSVMMQSTVADTVGINYGDTGGFDLSIRPVSEVGMMGTGAVWGGLWLLGRRRR